ncbi:MAG: cysteine desulfurase CsdA, partial [Betaproteobacteria bacterium]|nr:cysteine desulfurase CsdA [Betaproteobacteria bacterium]
MSGREPLAAAVAPPTALDVARLRRDFPILDLKVNDKPLIFLDNAASSQMPRQVMERWIKYRSEQHA